MLIKRKEKSPILPPDEKEMTVRLKNWGGITPSVYLRIFLGALAMVVLFLLFFLPGIINYGTWVKVTSLPHGAIVSVDGHYAGTTPTRFFLPANSSYKILVERELFSPYSQTIKAKGRTFATLFFPVKESIEVSWEKPTAMEPLFATPLARFCDFALADKEYEASFRKYAARSLESTYFFTEELEFFVEDFKGFLSTEQIEAALMKALPLCTHEVTVQSVVRAYSHLHNISQKKAAAQIKEALAAAKQRPALASYSRAGEFYALGERWVHFVSDQKPSKEFWIQEREVTVALYSQFLRETPDFNRENAAFLEERGLVDAFYMRAFPTNPSLPAVSLSWHATQAFCRWLEQQNAFRGYRARLPYSFELEGLSQADNPQWVNGDSLSLRAAAHAQANTLKDVLGNAWEWCQNPPLKGSALTDEFLLNLPTEIKAVFRGSYLTPKEETTHTGALLGIWSSPYTGFRVVLEKKSNE